MFSSSNSSNRAAAVDCIGTWLGDGVAAEVEATEVGLGTADGLAEVGRASLKNGDYNITHYKRR